MLVEKLTTVHGLIATRSSLTTVVDYAYTTARIARSATWWGGTRLRTTGGLLATTAWCNEFCVYIRARKGVNDREYDRRREEKRDFEEQCDIIGTWSNTTIKQTLLHSSKRRVYNKYAPLHGAAVEISEQSSETTESQTTWKAITK